MVSVKATHHKQPNEIGVSVDVFGCVHRLVVGLSVSILYFNLKEILSHGKFPIRLCSISTHALEIVSRYF
jgi:hypothetical protein